ncbi:hypothetical protein MIND_00396000 [Mycena indigotica]|uniref:Uncharacterized protein n=1 Tax=Mycena indigotica TaxID=2126181 RepID=A0A8H6T3C2_9AGAR|nr:uncharacterized protein MIND_00396000 [Mycena indigotica]KAF7310223.1 hypothetical protein MIND_00396000 [Mycena indigotica]
MVWWSFGDQVKIFLCFPGLCGPSFSRRFLRSARFSTPTCCSVTRALCRGFRLPAADNLLKTNVWSMTRALCRGFLPPHWLFLPIRPCNVWGGWEFEKGGAGARWRDTRGLHHLGEPWRFENTSPSPSFLFLSDASRFRRYSFASTFSFEQRQNPANCCMLAVLQQQ